ncbi:hypothetical protein GOV06_00475 [Candidatus Woesearchaeota archaeon]|nr:hypothetical protein [Candidatus Woesearchaeota archaeon]
MSVLAYSELLKRIVGIDEKKLEKPFIILSKHNTTKNRLNILKELAQNEKITVGKLLRNLHQNIGGGSYLTIKKYFLELEKEGLLKKEKIKNKEIWSFSEEYKDLKEFILK